MKITNIKQQVKRADRYSIYVDDKYAFSLSEGELLKLKLRVKQEFTQQGLEDLRQKAVIGKAYDQSINLIMRRPRSEWELRDYLKRKDCQPEVIDLTIDRLKNRRYVDDAAFAKRWVENRRLLKSTSKRRLQQELRQKRVGDEAITLALDADDADEHQILRDLIEKKRRQTRYQDKTKLMQYLIRQGFNYGDIKQVLDGDS